MDEKVLDELKFHQDTVARDDNSPLHLIREKELEISGRVLAAKREAEEIVAAARKKAAERVARAEDEASGLAEKREKELLAEADAEASRITAASEADASELEGAVAGRVPSAVDFVVEAVSGTRR